MFRARSWRDGRARRRVVGNQCGERNYALPTLRCRVCAGSSDRAAEQVCDWLVLIDTGRCLYQGATEALLASVAPGLDVTPQRPSDVAVLARLLADHGHRVEASGDRLSVGVEGAEVSAVAAAVNQAAFSAGVVLVELTPRRATLERSDLSPEPLQVTLDLHELGLRSAMAMVTIVVGALHERLQLAPEEPQPWIPLNDTDSILKLTGINRCLDLALGQPNSSRAVLSLSVAPFRRHSSSIGCFLPALSACT